MVPMVTQAQNTPTVSHWLEDMSSDFPSFDPYRFIEDLDGHPADETVMPVSTDDSMGADASSAMADD